jgi:hypothetical protein
VKALPLDGFVIVFGHAAVGIVGVSSVLVVGIGFYTTDMPATPIPDKTRYLHYDNLGSIDTITDGQGNIFFPNLTQPTITRWISIFQWIVSSIRISIVILCVVRMEYIRVGTKESYQRRRNWCSIRSNYRWYCRALWQHLCNKQLLLLQSLLHIF